MPLVYQWKEIKDNFSDTLIVGNGGSIAIEPNFSYKKLYQWGKDNKHIKENSQAIFQHFSANQRDFERILNKLNQADFINRKVDIAEVERKKVRRAYTDVRRSLVDTVKGLHPDLSEVDGDIFLVKQYLSHFNLIFSLNYDLLIYWAALAWLKDFPHSVKDGFYLRDKVKGSSSLLFDHEEFPARNMKAAELYFPHGNLLFYSTKLDDEKKVIADGKDGLLKTITKAWARNDSQPLFICEGDSSQKLKQINSSRYLSHVYHNVLPNQQDSVTIYGWSMGLQDTHILAQLKQARPLRVAVSIYTEQEVHLQEKEMNHALDMLINEVGVDAREIVFFDAQSDRCWNNP